MITTMAITENNEEGKSTSMNANPVIYPHQPGVIKKICLQCNTG